jgi:hypothetical protein
MSVTLSEAHIAEDITEHMINMATTAYEKTGAVLARYWHNLCYDHFLDT